MANYDKPFGENSEKRLPNATEKNLGFPCGPASQSLFNGMMHQLQAELKAIHDAGGIAGSDNVFNTTLLNIQALIDAATGGGDTTGYLLLSQAVARLPIFPEFITADGKINVSAPASGTIRLPGGITFMHRGIKPISTTETDFSTDISKTYHLRWNPNDGFELKDLQSSTYNPNSLQEDDSGFDSSYDDMLISRVITNSSNVATITNLINKNNIYLSEVISGTDVNFDGVSTYHFNIRNVHDWSRTPKTWSLNLVLGDKSGTVTDNDYAVKKGLSNYGTVNVNDMFDLNRYSLKQTILRDDTTGLAMHFSAGA